MSTSPRGYKGNKQSLPSKPCVACGRPMTWRKRWERTWEAVKYCSEACRRQGAGGGDQRLSSRTAPRA